MISPALVTLMRGLGDVCFPPACAICFAAHIADTDGIVCGTCLSRLTPLVHPLCARCGHPRLSPFNPAPASSSAPGTGAPPVISPCRWCARLPPIVRSARSVCRIDDGTGAALIHALKYGGWPAVSLSMGRRMARLSFPPDVVRERTALVPLPLSPARKRERGYNQSERLARVIAPLWTMPVWTGVLVRSRDTRSQVQLTPSERATNVSDAFSTTAAAGGKLQGAHIVLVDDVITTAASLNAAASALASGGARIISYVTFGRAPDPGDRTVSDLDLEKE